MMADFAPVAVFAHRRADHLRRTLTSLAQCKFADKTDVTIFLDGAKDNSQLTAVSNTLAVANCSYSFKSCTVHARDQNVGLKSNIIEGISSILREHESVIVLEDDILCSQDFLIYMNKFLSLYSQEDRVWHINGWNYDCEFQSAEKYYFSRIMNCWGWATWRDRWEKLELDAEAACRSLSFSERREFNCDWTFPFFSQLLGNAIGVNNTWAILWYYTIFKHKGLCISPRHARNYNIGNDGSGTHHTLVPNSSEFENFQSMNWDFVDKKISIHESKIHLSDLKVHFCQLFSLKRRIMGLVKAILPLRVSTLLFGVKQ